MKKNSIDKLLTLNFGRMCTANFLLFASVYLILPSLFQQVSTQVEVPVSEIAYLYAAFAAGMLGIGPFHAYLGDTYKRQRVLELSMLLLGLATAGYTLANQWGQFLVLAALQGVGFGGATAAGITVAIDITASTRRGEGNKIFTFFGRLGMLAGVVASYGLAARYDFRLLSYLSVGCLLGAFCLSSRVSVLFRAPIGVPLCSFDRFLLPRAWLPALNVGLLSVVPGLLWASSEPGHVLYTCLAFGGLCLLSVPLTHFFVQLSQHCQRGTANLTYQLMTDLGVLAGLFLVPQLERVGDVMFSLGVLGILGFLLLSIPYYRHMKVR